MELVVLARTEGKKNYMKICVKHIEASFGRWTSFRRSNCYQSWHERDNLDSNLLVTVEWFFLVYTHFLQFSAKIICCLRAGKIRPRNEWRRFLSNCELVSHAAQISKIARERLKMQTKTPKIFRNMANVKRVLVLCRESESSHPESRQDKDCEQVESFRKPSI